MAHGHGVVDEVVDPSVEVLVLGVVEVKGVVGHGIDGLHFVAAVQLGLISGQVKIGFKHSTSGGSHTVTGLGQVTMGDGHSITATQKWLGLYLGNLSTFRYLAEAE